MGDARRDARRRRCASARRARACAATSRSRAASTCRSCSARARPTCAAGWAASRAARCARATTRCACSRRRCRRRARLAPSEIPATRPSRRSAWCSGPQADRFTAEGIAALLGGRLRDAAAVGPHGRAPARARASPTRAATTSSPTASRSASIQVPGDGQPIVLLVDRQSTGGYTKIATVCSFDIGRIGQVKPGQRVRFRARRRGRGAPRCAARRPMAGARGWHLV